MTGSRARSAAAAASLALAVFVAGPPVGGAATTGTVFGGQTSQQDPFSLTVSRDHKRLVSAEIWVDATCANGSFAQYSATVHFAAKLPPTTTSRDVAVPNTLSPKGAIKAKGAALADYGTAIGTVSETWTGRVRGSRLTGTLGLRLSLVDKASHAPVTTCSKRVTFTAVMAPGRVFAGKTSDDLPVELELDQLHTRVNVVHIGWAAPCTPSGATFALGDVLTRFPLSTSNSFGDSFTYGPFDLPGGGKRTFAYVLRGTVGRTKARGTFKVTATDTDATGATTDTCTSATVSWVAVS